MSYPVEHDPSKWLDDFGDALYRYALVRVRSEPVAEDLVQETLLAGLVSLDKFSGQASVKTWLTGILKHKIVDYFRKHSNEPVFISDFEDDDGVSAYQFDGQGHWQVDLIEWGSPDKVMDSDQFWKIFYHCLARLPQNMADLFTLRAVQGLSSEECCKVIGMASTNQMCVALSRTRMKLRLCLESQWFGEE